MQIPRRRNDFDQSARECTRAAGACGATLNMAAGLPRVRVFFTCADLKFFQSPSDPGELKLRAVRPHYFPDFYAAYVRDPDGNKLAAVCRGYTERQ